MEETALGSDQLQLKVSMFDQDLPELAEKLRLRKSFQRARLVSSVHLHLQSTPLSKEFQEQGQVKIEVYAQYVQAALKFGFVLYLLITVAQQALSVLATLVLRYWGEHNCKIGGNSGMLEYLLLYSGFSFGSSLLGALSAIILWIYCALQSTHHLHDSVCVLGICQTFGLSAHVGCYYRCCMLSYRLLSPSLSEYLLGGTILQVLSWKIDTHDFIGFWTSCLMMFMWLIRFSLVLYISYVGHWLAAYPLSLSLVAAFLSFLFQCFLLVGFTLESWGILYFLSFGIYI